MTLSAVCEAFKCLPSQAEAELLRNANLVYEILEYRNARSVLDLTERGEAGAKVLSQNPDLMRAIERLEMSQHDFAEWHAYDVNERATRRQKSPTNRVQEEEV